MVELPGRADRRPIVIIMALRWRHFWLFAKSRKIMIFGGRQVTGFGHFLKIFKKFLKILVKNWSLSHGFSAIFAKFWKFLEILVKMAEKAAARVIFGRKSLAGAGSSNPSKVPWELCSGRQKLALGVPFSIGHREERPLARPLGRAWSGPRVAGKNPRHVLRRASAAHTGARSQASLPEPLLCQGLGHFGRLNDWLGYFGQIRWDLRSFPGIEMVICPAWRGQKG